MDMFIKKGNKCKFHKGSTTLRTFLILPFIFIGMVLAIYYIIVYPNRFVEIGKAVDIGTELRQLAVSAGLNAMEQHIDPTARTRGSVRVLPIKEGMSIQTRTRKIFEENVAKWSKLNGNDIFFEVVDFSATLSQPGYTEDSDFGTVTDISYSGYNEGVSSQKATTAEANKDLIPKLNGHLEIRFKSVLLNESLMQKFWGGKTMKLNFEVQMHHRNVPQ